MDHKANSILDLATLTKTLEEVIRQVQKDASQLASLRSQILALELGKSCASDLTPTEIVLSILKSKEGRATIKELRNEIMHMGVPTEKFGQRFGYFYKILERLEEGEKIERDGDAITMREAVGT